MTKNSRVIDQYMDSLLANHEIAGSALLIREKGEKVYEACFGVRNLDKKEAVTNDTVFRLASMTKPIIAIAIMMLVEREKLSLTSSIVEFLPTFKGKEAVQIIHLLNHSSGLGHGEAGMTFYQKHMHVGEDLETRVNKWNTMPFDFQPGTDTNYSPLVGFDLLGRIIEIISGVDLQTFLQEAIFQPLGISDITFSLTSDQERRLAKLYEAKDGKLLDDSLTDQDIFLLDAKNGYYSGGAGLFGTIRDYEKIVALLGGKGKYNGVRLLSEENIALMHTTGMVLDKELLPGVRWGLGMAVFEQPALSKLPMSNGSFGWSGAFGTHMWIDPQKEIEVVLMLNRSNIDGAGSYISREVEKLTYEFIDSREE